MEDRAKKTYLYHAGKEMHIYYIISMSLLSRCSHIPHGQTMRESRGPSAAGGHVADLF